jgi:alcohol dehydrogenase
MMKTFNYHMPTRVLFGCGALDELTSVAKEMNVKKALVVSGKGSMRKTGTLERVISLLGETECIVFEDVESDPSNETVDEGVQLGQDCKAVIGLGGGSALDAAKAISAILGNGGSAGEYIKGKKADRPGPPIIAIPTTSGTGSEVTEVSVLADRKQMIKKSFRSKHMYPAVAIDDPILTKTMPDNITASSGLDALTHAIEALTSKKSQPITDVLCLEAGKLILENIRTVYEDGQDMIARENMMLGSLIAGFGITHAAAGLAHGLSYSLWKVAETPHGLACGMLLPHVMRFNTGYDGGKYEILARYCGFKNQEDLIGRVEDLNKVMRVPSRLRGLGISDANVEDMVGLAMGGSTQVNPRPIDEKEMAEFIMAII